MRASFVAFFVIGLLAGSSEALACSCEMAPKDLHEALTQARDRATAIFLGRADRIDSEDGPPGSPSVRQHRVTFEVLETYKGTVSPRQVVTTRRPDGASCGYEFTTGGRYLVYAWAEGQGGLGTNMCSRTRFVGAADAEVEALRTGRLPPRPVALRRERVSCTACDLEALATALVCKGAKRCAPTPGHKVAEALREGRPFWSEPRASRSRTAHVYGVSAEGRAFELVRRPALLDSRCLTQVDRHGCARLALIPIERRRGLIAECVDPEPAERMCDEATTRRASWGPVEELPRAGCDWDWVGEPDCVLDMKAPPLMKDGAPAVRPGLLCSEGSGDNYSCRAVTDVTPRPPDTVGPPPPLQ